LKGKAPNARTEDLLPVGHGQLFGRCGERRVDSVLNDRVRMAPV
jgi:hypothetical protein